MINRNLVCLPIPENFTDEGTFAYITSFIVDPLEHFIYHGDGVLVMRWVLNLYHLILMLITSRKLKNMTHKEIVIFNFQMKFA